MAAAKKLPPFMKNMDKDDAPKGAPTPFPPKSGKKGAVPPTMPAPKKGASAAKAKKGMCPACLKAKKKTCTH